jgi:hypothetical protein
VNATRERALCPNERPARTEILLFTDGPHAACSKSIIAKIILRRFLDEDSMSDRSAINISWLDRAFASVACN